MRRSKQIKMLSAVVGAGAFAAMAVLTVGVGHDQPGTRTFMSVSGATLGETATTTTPPAEPVTSKAVPPFTFTTPPGFAAPH